MQLGLGAASRALPAQRQLQQRCYKGSLCCDKKDATQSLYPGAAGGDAQGSLAPLLRERAPANG